MAARLRKQRVGLNRGLPRVWGLYAWRLAGRACIGSCEGASEALRDVVESAGEADGDQLVIGATAVRGGDLRQGAGHLLGQRLGPVDRPRIEWCGGMRFTRHACETFLVAGKIDACRRLQRRHASPLIDESNRRP